MSALPCSITASQPQAIAAAQYIRSLSVFDWQYEFSDDLAVYRRGASALQALREMQREVDPTGELWLSIAPRGHGVPQPIVQGA